MVDERPDPRSAETGVSYLSSHGEGQHILLVEDDEDLRKLLLTHLRRSGFRASGARDGIEMHRLLASAPVDLVILDVMLPGRSGYELCKDLRSQGALPIILLTALGETTDRVKGLDIGADDFVVKPADPLELVARIRALLRRAAFKEGDLSLEEREVACFAGWRLHTRRRELVRPDGAEVGLTSGEYDILLAFVERPQRILSREQLLDVARNRAYGGVGRSIDVQVSRLRAKLDGVSDAEGNSSLIKTVRGVGYFFAPSVEWAT
ncbi:Two-component response regulator (plasmid) [Roseomonas mucosa]|uniref:response regulator transcription factor n=1 Tax=Roseomonas mucosa TaxID=207340 RepID=UPI0024C5D09A|nr:response regulator transcription factor [Roseomonas mucosa]MDU7520619.1 response regulator transcription factor [Roseomonas mucosa]QDD92769.1 Two-component response regulator [Roseomonas mucosa]